MARPRRPPGLGRRSIGSMPTEALRAAFCSKIAIGTSSGPAWLNELQVRIHKGGSRKMAKRITICAGIDTGKRKLDVALDGSSERTQVDNTPEGYTVLLEWLKRHEGMRAAMEASGGSEQAGGAALRRKRGV